MHEPVCEILLEKLCTAVQKVQEQYASGQEVIRDSESVNQLCKSVDDIFSHGLREGILNWASGSETTYWPLVAKISYKEVLQSISRIPSIKNDREKCQVWVRIACQENSLGSYLNIITQDEKLLLDFYQPYAFVFDKEKVDTAKTALLYGLSHLDFNISLDIPQKHQTSVKGLFTNPEKSTTTNGLSSSHPSTNSSHSNSYTMSSSLNIPRGSSGPKKKKKIKSSVAVIADSLDDGMEAMTSVEKYLYNMSPALENSNVNTETNDILKEPEDVENIMTKERIQTDTDTRESFTTKNEQGNVSGLMQHVQTSDEDTSVEKEDVSDLVERLKAMDEKTVVENEGISSLMQNVQLTEESEYVKKDIEDGPQNVKDLSTGESRPETVDVVIESKVNNYFKDTTDDEFNIGKDGEENDLNTRIDGLQNEKENCNCKNNEGYNNGDYHNLSQRKSHSNTMKLTQTSISHDDNVHETDSQILQNAFDEEKQLNQNENKSFEQKETMNLDNEYDYQVSRASFQYGTPTKHSQIEDLTNEDVYGDNVEDSEDLNFVPGIHKTDPRKSNSGSFSSLTGSGSFNIQNKPDVEETRRSSTMDSRSSVSSSLPLNDPWGYVTNSLSSINRKDSKADDMSIATEDSLGDLSMFEELLGMSEDHFSSPEQSFMGLSSSEELHHAIVSCKEMIKSTQNPEEKKKLVKRLIQLRMKVQESKDDSFKEQIPHARKILGHQFIKEEDTSALSNILCDKCGKWIWTIWQSLFTCQDCQFHSHRKCLDLIRRHCASRKVSVSSYSLNITPETGLHAQQYKCVECRKMISLAKSGQGEARLCDYSGQYFCEDCHWNDQVVIPARVVHNWDFSIYKVSRQTKQFLDLMAKKPILDLQQLNPALFKFVGELRDIKRFREEILIMKKYFMSCRSALESKLLLHLQDRQHFVDNSSNYSLQDLLEVERGTLLPFITRIHSLFLTHIKSDCELCRAKGFVCEICRANEIIFAFDPHAVQCSKCRTVFHRLCFKKDSCPKCQRIQKRTPKGP